MIKNPVNIGFTQRPAKNKRKGEFQTLYKELIDNETKFYLYFRVQDVNEHVRCFNEKI